MQNGALVPLLLLALVVVCFTTASEYTQVLPAASNRLSAVSSPRASDPALYEMLRDVQSKLNNAASLLHGTKAAVTQIMQQSTGGSRPQALPKAAHPPLGWECIAPAGRAVPCQRAHRVCRSGAVVWGMSFKWVALATAVLHARHAAICGAPDGRGKSWWPDRPDMRCGVTLSERAQSGRGVQIVARI